jgi:selenocysteine lyase/cysteine desulfurase
VKAAGVHFLSTDSHKWLLGPPGVGALFVDEAVLPRIEPVLVGWRSTREALNFDQAKLELRDDAAKFEEGNLPYALIEGMGAAVDLLLEVGVDAVWARIRALGDRLVDQLRAGGHAIDSPTGDDPARSGTIAFRSANGRDPVDLVARAAAAGVMVSARRGRVRVSPHFYNTPDELDRLVDILPR